MDIDDVSFFKEEAEKAEKQKLLELLNDGSITKDIYMICNPEDKEMILDGLKYVGIEKAYMVFSRIVEKGKVYIISDKYFVNYIKESIPPVQITKEPLWKIITTK